MNREILNSPNLQLFIRLPGGERLERSDHHDGLPFLVRVCTGPVVAAELLISAAEATRHLCNITDSIPDFVSISMCGNTITIPMDLALVVEERLPAGPPREALRRSAESEDQPGVAHFRIHRECAASSIPPLPLNFSVVASSTSRDLRRLRFIFEQYTYFREFAVDENLSADSMRANIGSRGIESTGYFIRHGLHFGGRLAGSTIRALGKLYTDVVTINNSDEPPTEQTISTELIETVERRRENARQFRDTARTVSSALMYPVRWAGQQAALLTDAEAEPDPDSLLKVASDTAGGISNAFTAVVKGVQEATGEIGEAIRDVALEHARRVKGEDYAQTVTATYLEAGADVCRGALSAANVATLGSAGILVGAAIESGDMYFNFYEYLVGPVLLQGFVYFSSIPAMRPTLKYAVLRPWSLCLYSGCGGLTDKPEKTIATSNLGALPRLDSMKYLDVTMITSAADALHTSAIASKTWACEALEFHSIDGSSYTMFASPSSEVPITEWLRELKLACTRVETVSKPMSGAHELRESRRAHLLPKTFKLNALVRGFKVLLGGNSLQPVWPNTEAHFTVRLKKSHDLYHISSIFVTVVPLTAEGSELFDEIKTSSRQSTLTIDPNADTFVAFSPIEAFQFGNISSLGVSDCFRLRFSVFGSGVMYNSAPESHAAPMALPDPSAALLIGVGEASVSPSSPSFAQDLSLQLAVEGISNASLDAIVSLIKV